MERGHNRWAQEEPETGGSQGAGSDIHPPLHSFLHLFQYRSVCLLCSADPLGGRGLPRIPMPRPLLSRCPELLPSPSLSPSPSFLPLHLPIAAPSPSIPWPTLPIPFLSLSQPDRSVSSETAVFPHCLKECLGGMVRWFKRQRLLLSRLIPRTHRVEKENHCSLPYTHTHTNTVFKRMTHCEHLTLDNSMEEDRVAPDPRSMACYLQPPTEHTDPQGHQPSVVPWSSHKH